MSPTDPLAIKQWDPNSLITTIVGMQNFARVWALQISHRQAHIAQQMLSTCDLATRAFTNAAQQSSQLKITQSQISTVDKIKQMVENLEEQIKDAMVAVVALQEALDHADANKSKS